jgi:MFS family permease
VAPAGARPRAAPAAARARGGFYRSAAAMDGGFFLIMVAMPYKVLALGGGALELGLVGAIGAVTYIVSAPLTGRWSDRANRTLLCLAGGSLLIAAAVLAWLVRRLDLLLALQLLVGFGKALYWPAVQATLGDLSPGTARVGALGRFNVAWSGGKTAGFLLGGLLLSCCGFRTVYLAGAAAVAAAFLLLPRGALVAAARQQTAEDDGSGRPAPANPPAADPDRLRTFLAMSWTANAAAYGAFGILHFHLPQWFAHRGWDPGHYGWFLGAVLASQTAVFLLLGGRVRLVWSATRLWLPQVGGLAAVAVIPWLADFRWLLGIAPLIGLACGVSYAASIFYSLEAPAARGRNAGIHEGLIGAGGFLPPLAAGLMIRAGLALHAPYLLAGALLLGALVLQAAFFRRGSRA